MIIILTTDFEIGGHVNKKGTAITVTNDYGKRLILNKVARKENFVEVLSHKKKK